MILLTNKVFVTNSDSGILYIIEPEDNIITNVTIGHKLISIAVDPSSSSSNALFVADLHYNSANGKINGGVYGIDGYSRMMSSNVTVGEGVLSDIAVNPVTNAVYVADSSNGDVYVIDSSGIVTSTVKVGMDPVSIAINPRNNMVYVVDEGSNAVSVIDGNTNKVTREINMSGAPRAVAVNSQTNSIYVTNEESKTVSVIDGNTNKVTRTIPVGDFPGGYSGQSKHKQGVCCQQIFKYNFYYRWRYWKSNSRGAYQSESS